MELLNGKELAKQIKSQIKEELKNVPQSKRPVLTAILVGNDPASEIYVNNKAKACQECGIISRTVDLPETATQEELDQAVKDSVLVSDGVIVQLPLPNNLNTDILEEFPDKDVDGFTQTNLGRLFQEKECFIPATPLGVITMLTSYKIPTENRNVVIIGRSNTVGKPLATILSGKEFNANVTLLHSKTSKSKLKYYCSLADIIIVAVGKPKFFTEECLNYYDVAEGRVIYSCGKTIIDIGINRDINGKVVGDVDIDSVKDYCDYITPVPGGVGPMTVVSLLKNTVNSWKRFRLVWELN